MRGSLGTKTLLGGLQDVPGQVSAGNPCGGPLCQPHLCAPPLIPHTVYAAICQVTILAKMCLKFLVYIQNSDSVTSLLMDIVLAHLVLFDLSS